MSTVVCALLSGGMFFLSAGLGTVWPLAWIAAVPLLWLAYSGRPGWQVFLASFAAYAAGMLNLLEAYAIMLPGLAYVFGTAAIGFGCAVAFAQFAWKRLPPAVGAFAFPTLWTALEFLFSKISPHGTYGSLAYSQVRVPLLIQDASIFGIWSVTFLLCAVASGIALLVRDWRRGLSAAVAIALIFAANAVFGYVRLAAPVEQAVRVGAVADDSVRFGWKRNTALAVARRYAAEARGAAARGATTVVLPEKIALYQPQWRDVAAVYAGVARQTGARIVVSFEEHAAQQQNVALTFEPGGTVARYAKRHLVPGFELLVPGDRPGLLGNGLAVVICKDMDYPETIRDDAKHGIVLMLVPAFDFVMDASTHANMAIMRGVEDGFAEVRSARSGLLTISDAQGRVVASAPSSPSGPVTIVADVSPGLGHTPYLQIGDIFAWICLVASLGLGAFLTLGLGHAMK